MEEIQRNEIEYFPDDVVQITERKGTMKSIVVTYPYFQSLPKGLKMLLVESEGFFFREIGSAPAKPIVRSKATRMDHNDVLRFRTPSRSHNETAQGNSSEEQSLSE